MGEISAADLKAIAPYSDDEFQEARSRILCSPIFLRIAHDYFPDINPEILRTKAAELRTIQEFQETFIDQLISRLQKRTTDGVTIQGGEGRPKNQSYLYISNHRDIILDPAVFTRAIHTQGYRTPQICLGDNLLGNPLVVDLVKMNKGITVKRDLPPRELLHWSQVLSQWIHSQITANLDSVWIAQREGRAKDGHDETQAGVLKMLALAGRGDFISRLRALRIIPVAISYEYDPSDLEKSVELATKAQGNEYHKTPNEDVETMYRGIHGFKGRIHVQVGDGIEHGLEEAAKLRSKSEQARCVASEIDKHIHRQYHHWPTHFIAYDLLQGVSRFSDRYTKDEKAGFEARLAKRLGELPPHSDQNLVRRLFLEMYARPIFNRDLEHPTPNDTRPRQTP